MGGAMLHQEGVAMAFVAEVAYPEYSRPLGAVVISAVFIFELLGPVATRICLDRNA
jgi:hypothetical protein